jgi:hypothetical protein
LFAQHVGFEESPIGGEQPLQLPAFRAAHRLPAAEQEPALAAAVFSHHGAGAKEFLAPHLVEGRAGVLEHMEFVEDHLRLFQHLANRIVIRPMHVRADGRDRRTLPGSQILRQQRGSRALTSVLSAGAR